MNTVMMMEISFLNITIFAIVAVMTSFIGMKLYLVLPPSWLCEYDELPGDEHGRDARLFGRCSESFLIFSGASLCFAALCWNLYCFQMMSAFGYEISILLFLFKVSVVFIVLYISALSDLRYRIIPDQSGIILVLSALIFAILEEDRLAAFLNVGIGTAVAGGLMMMTAVVSCLFYGNNAMGFGDVKLMASCGAVVGGTNAAGIFVIASLSSAIYFLAGLLSKKFKSDETQAMAPWIGLATIICVYIN